MGKPPLMGQVKTRLSRDVGYAAAVGFYRHAVARLLLRLGFDRRWDTRLAVNNRGEADYSCWPQQIVRMPQGTGHLGQRMGYVFAKLPPGPAVIIGTDSPQIEPSAIAAAFQMLGQKDAVFGPAEDGGFWLIGLARRRPTPDLFQGVRWSTGHALEDTIKTLPPAQRVGLLDTMLDVDQADDKNALGAQYGPFRYGPWLRKSCDD